MKPVIAIDGPAAAGKGTLARRLAAHFGLPYLDTGLLYRAVGRRVLDAGGDPAIRRPPKPPPALRPDDLDRTDLRGPAGGRRRRRRRRNPRRARRPTGLSARRSPPRIGAVLDGRDIGTVIFPEARRNCSSPPALAERTRRRWLELQAKGVVVDIADVEQEMRRRDAKDSARESAPLRAAEDAFILDTSTLDADAAFRVAIGFVRARTGLACGAR